MARRGGTVRGFGVHETRPTPQPHATIDTRDQSRRAQVQQFTGGEGDDTDDDTLAKVAAEFQDPDEEDEGGTPFSLKRLMKFATHNGNLCDLLPQGEVQAIGEDVIRQWRDDDATRKTWVEQAERSLDEAAQEDAFGEEEGTGKDTPWDNASNIRYPILSKATLDWNARAYPELVKGDTVVKPRTFEKPPNLPDAAEQASNQPPPQNPQDADAASQQIQNGDMSAQDSANDQLKKESRAKRVAMFINHTIFYRMDNWEGETDLLFAQMPPIGQGFKKVYMGADGVQSDFVSAIDLCVDNDRTKSLSRCPRISHPFERYPYEIDEMMGAGRWNDISLTPIGSDPEEPRKLLEQIRNEDLDKDGVSEPYIVTVDVETRQVLCIEAAYTMEDVFIDETAKPPKVLRFERWKTYADFKFLPDPRGKFYGMGFGKLLRSICDAVDTSINQMMDANTAAIAGGGFMGAGVRISGGGQGGSIYYTPGEYKTVSAPGNDLRAAIFERTVPNMGPATMQLMEMLLAAAKDLASVKDVLSGEGPQNAPVGTTLAIQQQAMQSFSAVFKRVYRGFREEASMIYQCLKRWARPQDKKDYEELTGGNWDEDFEGDDKDIELVADPNVVSRLMKISRLQALTQLAESEVGKAAGMLENGPATEMVKEGLDAMDIDRPERFISKPSPNPELMAKVGEINASTQSKQAGAALDKQKADKLVSEANLDRAKALGELAWAHTEGDKLNQSADNIMTTGLAQPAEEQSNGPEPGAAPSQPQPAGAPAGPS